MKVKLSFETHTEFFVNWNFQSQSCSNSNLSSLPSTVRLPNRPLFHPLLAAKLISTYHQKGECFWFSNFFRFKLELEKFRIFWKFGTRGICIRKRCPPDNVAIRRGASPSGQSSSVCQCLPNRRLPGKWFPNQVVFRLVCLSWRCSALMSQKARRFGNQVWVEKWRDLIWLGEALNECWRAALRKGHQNNLPRGSRS